MQIQQQYQFCLIVFVTLLILGLSPQSTWANDDRNIVSNNNSQSDSPTISGVDKKTQNPRAPKEETSEEIFKYTQELLKVHREMERKIATIGPIDFAEGKELKSKQHVIELKSNLENFQTVRQDYYNSIDSLIVNYKKRLNLSSDRDQRLGGSIHQVLEKNENIFVYDMVSFYDFILRHHDDIIFDDEDVPNFENEDLYSKFVDLLTKIEKSSKDFSSAQEAFTEEQNKLISRLNQHSKKPVPTQPDQKLQEMVLDFTLGLAQIYNKSNKEMTAIGGFDVNLREVKTKEDILKLIVTIEKGQKIRKTHFDSLDTLIKKHRNNLGIKSTQNKRLAGTIYEDLEIAEAIHIKNLKVFYDFLFENFANLSFKDGGIFVEKQSLAPTLNSLIQKITISGTELNQAKSLTDQNPFYSILEE